MSEHFFPGDKRVPADVARKIDSICLQFEAAWRAGLAPSIDAAIAGYEGIERSVLIGELLVTDIEFRIKNGEEVDFQTYAPMLPDDRPLIRWALLKSSSFLDGGKMRWQFGSFQATKKLETGGMSIVFEGQDAATQERVAIKVLSPDLLNVAAAVKQFLIESEVACKVRHPNVASAREFGTIDQLPYLVMEHLDGLTLNEVVDQKGPLVVPEACECICQALQGLQHIHELGIIHRDVKPSNLFLIKEPRVKIFDLGFARTGSMANVEGEKFIGTLPFMAPEQLDDPYSANVRSDLFSVGCTLFYLLFGRSPLAPTDDKRPDRHSVRYDIAAKCSHLPSPLPDLISRLLAANAEERPESAAEVARELQTLRQRANISKLWGSG